MNGLGIEAPDKTGSKHGNLMSVFHEFCFVSFYYLEDRNLLALVQ
jgi:hypothetical protein